MITGDHPLTSFAIARELEMVKAFNEVTTGKELDEYLEKGEKEFEEFIKDKKYLVELPHYKNLQS